MGFSLGGLRCGPDGAQTKRVAWAAIGGRERDSSPKAKTTNAGRLARRSAEDVAKAVDQVVALVKQSKTGLRSEDIKKRLGFDRREIPRILKTGLETKKLRATGQKRATTYFAAGSGSASLPRKPSKRASKSNDSRCPVLTPS
jgi:hypothetical protein